MQFVFALIFPLCMDSNAMEKSTNSSVALRFFALTSSMMQRIVRIYEVMDRFLRKPFCYFQRIFSILSWIRLRSHLSMRRGRLDVLAISLFFFIDNVA